MCEKKKLYDRRTLKNHQPLFDRSKKTKESTMYDENRKIFDISLAGNASHQKRYWEGRFAPDPTNVLFLKTDKTGGKVSRANSCRSGNSLSLSLSLSLFLRGDNEAR